MIDDVNVHLISVHAIIKECKLQLQQNGFPLTLYKNKNKKTFQEDKTKTK